MSTSDRPRRGVPATAAGVGAARRARGARGRLAAGTAAGTPSGPWWSGDDAHDPEPSGSTGSVITIGQFLRILRRRWLSVAAPVVVLCLLALTLLLTLPKSYESMAVVDLSPALTDASSTSATISTTTEARIVTSVSVARRAADALGSSLAPQDLVESVDVTSPLSSEVLDITFTASTPEGAAEGANAFARAYLSYRASTSEQDVTLREDKINTQVASLQSRLDRLDGQEGAQASAARSQTQGQLSKLQGQLTDLRTSVSVAGSLAGPASVPKAASSPKPLLFAAAGLVGGLLIGIALALVRDKVDHRVSSPQDLVELRGLSVLGRIPQPTASRGAEAGEPLRQLLRSRDPGSDAYRAVATTLVPGDHDGGPRSLLLVGVGLGAGHSVVPANLAATFAAQGLRTVLACTGPAAEHAARVLGVGLADQDGPLVHRLTGPGEVPGLRLLPLGDEVLLGATLRAGGGDLEPVLRHADVVVLDGVNTELASTDLVLGQLSDGAVVVVGARRARRDDVQRVLDQLATAGAAVLGALLVSRRTPRRDRRSQGRRGHARPAAPTSSSRRSPAPASRREPDPVDTERATSGRR